MRSAAMHGLCTGWAADADVAKLIRDLASDPEVGTAAMVVLATHWPGDPQILAILCGQVGKISDAEEVLGVLATYWRGNLGVISVIRAALYSRDLHAPLLGLRVDEKLIAGVAAWRDDPDVGAALREWAADSRFHNRVGAMRALAAGWTSHRETWSVLVGLAEHDNSRGIRSAAVHALATGYPKHADCAQYLVIRAAIDACNWHPAEAAAVVKAWNRNPILAGLLDRVREQEGPFSYRNAHEPERIQVHAIKVLGEGFPADDEFRPALCEVAADNPSAEVRRAAITAVAKRWPGHVDVLPFLLKIVNSDPQPYVVETALRTLGHWPTHDILELLRGRANQAAAVEAIGIGWPGDPELLGFLLGRATYSHTVDQPTGDSYAWQDGSGKLHQRDILASVEVGEPVRVAASQALRNGWPSDADVLELIVTCERASYSPESVREAYSRAMESTLNMVERLGSLAASEDDDVRSYARQALAVLEQHGLLGGSA